MGRRRVERSPRQWLRKTRSVFVKSVLVGKWSVYPVLACVADTCCVPAVLMHLTLSRHSDSGPVASDSVTTLSPCHRTLIILNNLPCYVFKPGESRSVMQTISRSLAWFRSNLFEWKFKNRKCSQLSCHHHSSVLCQKNIFQSFCYTQIHACQSESQSYKYSNTINDDIKNYCQQQQAVPLFLNSFIVLWTEEGKA